MKNTDANVRMTTAETTKPMGIPPAINLFITMEEMNASTDRTGTLLSKEFC
jgi:hypothetical protein